MREHLGSLRYFAVIGSEMVVFSTSLGVGALRILYEGWRTIWSNAMLVARIENGNFL